MISHAVSPWLKLAQKLRTVGVADTARHCRTVALHRAHAALDLRFHASARGDRTADKVELDQVTIANPSSCPSRAAGVHYLPTPWRVLDWVHAALPQPGRDWTFVDLGCGKGRVLLSAGRRPFGRVVGVEFASELAAAARANVAVASGLVADRIEIHEGDAGAFPIPAGPLVAFLFNPFGPPVIGAVAARLADANRRQPRPMIIAYLNPVHGDAFARLDGLAEVSLAAGLDLRFRLFSPYRLRVFATPEAQAHLALAPRR